MITGKDYDLEEILLAISCQLSAVSNYVNRQRIFYKFQFSVFNSRYTSYLYRYKR